eukprot:m51a1_g11906 hypothetical protein (316) ;mRNA; r:628112-629326
MNVLSGCSSESSGRAEDRCELVAGIFAPVLQVGVALALIALGSLVLKRYQEKPRRPWLIWSADTSKQAASAATAHLMNLLTALLMSVVAGAGGHTRVHQCSWYLITFLFDTTAGSLFSYIGTLLVFAAARRVGVRCLSHSGDYGTPPRATWWLAQTAAWILIVLVARMLNALIVYVLRVPLSFVAAWIAWPFRDYPKLFLTLIMIICPVFLNILQDQFLKGTEPSKGAARQREAEDEEAKPLLVNPSHSSPDSYSMATPAVSMRRQPPVSGSPDDHSQSGSMLSPPPSIITDAFLNREFGSLPSSSETVLFRAPN